MEILNYLQDKLISAIIKGQLKTVETIINTLELLGPCLDGYKYLCFAAEYRQDEIVEFFLKKNTPVNSSAHKFLNSPLNLAVKSEKIQTVKILLEAGAEIDKRNLHQRNSFDEALVHGNLEILELLVDHISDDNISTESYLKLLADLLKSSHYKLLEKLLTKSLHIDINEATPAENFLFIAVQKHYYSVVEFLLMRRIDVNFINYSRYGSQTSLFIACRIGDSKMAELLLQNGANVDIKYDFYYSNAPKNVDQYNLYPIHIAIVYGYRDVVEVLLNHGDDCNKKFVTPYETEYTALYLACEYHREEIVKLLVERGADVNFQDHRGYKPVFAAVSARENRNILNANYNIFEYLTANESLKLDFINMKAILTTAAQRFHVDILNLALQYKRLEPLVKYELYVDLMKNRSSNLLPHIVIKFNKSSLNGENFEKFIHIWIKHGFDVNCRDQNGKTLLHKAFWYRQVQAVELLLGLGSDYSICDEGYTPLDYILLPKFNKTTDEGNFGEENEILIDWVTQYFVKMNLLNRSVNEDDYRKLITINRDPYKYQSDYEKEIENMKCAVIGDGVTIYDFVTADLNKLVVLLKNEAIFKTLQSNNYKIEFPQYDCVIDGCFYKGLIRKNLLEKIDKFTIFYYINKLPYPCKRRVMDCFSNDDLRDVINEYSVLANSS